MCRCKSPRRPVYRCTVRFIGSARRTRRRGGGAGWGKSATPGVPIIVAVHILFPVPRAAGLLPMAILSLSNAHLAYGHVALARRHGALAGGSANVWA